MIVMKKIKTNVYVEAKIQIILHQPFDGTETVDNIHKTAKREALEIFERGITKLSTIRLHQDSLRVTCVAIEEE
jgi:hypothetical protein